MRMSIYNDYVIFLIIALLLTFMSKIRNFHTKKTGNFNVENRKIKKRKVFEARPQLCSQYITPFFAVYFITDVGSSNN